MKGSPELEVAIFCVGLCFLEVDLRRVNADFFFFKDLIYSFERERKRAHTQAGRAKGEGERI